MARDSGGVLLRPDAAVALLVLAHGAGAGMRHPFMEGLAQALAGRGVATWRFEFSYMASGRRLPPRPADATLVPEVRRAVLEAHAAVPELPLFAGGKSLGGRMTSTAASRAPLLPDGPADRVRGLIFFGFPLHSPKSPGVERAAHLGAVSPRMLFLQGDRDRLARLDLLTPVVRKLGPRATLRVVEGADHGFHVLKRSGRTDAQVHEELAGITATWMRDQLG